MSGSSNSSASSTSSSSTSSTSSSSSPRKMKMKMSEQESEKIVRMIGRWHIGETLGKGGYSWVKKGYDKKTGKAVALKFMTKADKSWAEEQTKQVITEIEALKQIHHPNVMKLYAYNLSAKYPEKNGNKLDVILLVLEYAPGGELFDILFYTSALAPDIARTYFRQMMAGLEACHKSGIAHRDIKPQNLLLDARFQLKITDFGLSRVFESDADSIMTTSYVGTRGYQAPELLLAKPYTLTCDIFSAGVVLFILLTGYPPFEQAHKGDRWYRPMIQCDVKKFWKAHRGCGIEREAKDLITRMLVFDPEKRVTIDQIKSHPWYKGRSLEVTELVGKLRLRHRSMEIKRKGDAKKKAEMEHSNVRRALPNVDEEELSKNAPDIPEDEEIQFRDVHTTIKPLIVMGFIYDWICDFGVCEFDRERFTMNLMVKDGQTDQTASIGVRFHRDPTASDKFGTDIHIVSFRRSNGMDCLLFNRVHKFLISEFGPVLTGLPDASANADPSSSDDEDTDDLEMDVDISSRASIGGPVATATVATVVAAGDDDAPPRLLTASA